MNREDQLCINEILRNPVQEAIERVWRSSDLSEEIARQALDINKLVSAHDYNTSFAAQQAYHTLTAGQAIAEADPVRQTIKALSGTFEPMASHMMTELAAPTVFEAVNLDQEKTDITLALSGTLGSAAAFNDFAKPDSVLGLAGLGTDLSDLLAPDRVLRELTKQFGEPLSGYTQYLAHVNASVSDIQSIAGATTLAAWQSDFSQLSAAGTALESLQRTSASLLDTLGVTASIQTVQDYVNRYQSADLHLNWVRDCQSVAEQVAAAMRYDFVDDGTYNTDGNEPIDEVVELKGGPATVPAERVHRVATAFIVSAYEIDIRLKRLAPRFDPMILAGPMTWGDLILLVAHGCPDRARDLVAVTYPLLQRLAWPTAPRGGCVSGTEDLSVEDAEEFQLLADALLRILSAIEESLA